MSKDSTEANRLVTLDNLGAWVFKCNPKTWDILEWIKQGNELVDDWTIADNYRTEMLAAGQPAILWVSGPTKGALVTPGIWGIGSVSGSARWSPRGSKAAAQKSHYKDLKKGQAATYWVPLEVNLLPNPLDRKIIAGDSILKNAEVFKQPQGSNPSFLTKEEYRALGRLIKKLPVTVKSPASPISTGKSGAGFGSAIQNAIVEKRAMDVVVAHYEARGYRVEDVSARKLGWDLTATSKKKKKIRHVEVKGVSGSTPKILLTQNEAKKATANPLWELAIVVEALSAKPRIMIFPPDAVLDAVKTFMWQANMTNSEIIKI